MSYRNPEIITDKSGEILAKGFASFGASAADAITKRGEAEEAYRKAEAERIRKEQELKTANQLEGAKLAGEIAADLPKTSITTGVMESIKKRIMATADVQSKLLNEFDDSKRDELLKQVTDTSSDIIAKKAGLLSFSEDATAYAESATSEIGVKYAFSGNNDEEQAASQFLLAAITGGLPEGEFTRKDSDTKDGYWVEVSGKDKSGNPITKKINLTNYKELMIEINPFKENTVLGISKLLKGEDNNIKKNLIGERAFQTVSANVYDANGKLTGGKQAMSGEIEILKSNDLDIELKDYLDTSVESFLKIDMQQQKAVLKNRFGINPDTIYKNAEGNATDANFQKEELKKQINDQLINEALGGQFKKGEINGKQVWYRGDLKPVAPVAKDKPSEKAIDRAIDKEDKRIFGNSLIENANKFSGGGDEAGTLKQFMNGEGDLRSDQIEAYGRAANIPNTVITKATPVFKTEIDADGVETQVQINLNEFIVANDRTGKQVPFKANQSISPEDIEGFAMTAYGFNATEVTEFKRKKAAFQKRTAEAKAKAEARRKGLINRE